MSSDEEEEPKKHGGSLPGKQPNKNRQPDKRYKHLMEQYFNEDRIYDAADFRRRFRMSERLFDRVYKGVLQTDPAYFEQRPDCTGKMGIHPLLKIVAALRVLAYGAPADSLDDNLEIGESTLHATLRHFVDAVSACFGDEYLRAPTTQDVTNLLAQNATRGFVGMLFSLDCMHWEWQNCPVSLAGQYKGKEKKPTMVLEACADADLWIWYASFGWPGSLNDINILDRSDFFDRLLRGEAPSVRFTVNGNEYKSAYCLADGIYPNWPVFLKTISEPATNKRKHYAALQEACRKDVERAFGVLQARWRIINIPSKFWTKATMSGIMRACIILHNMIVEDERDQDLGYDYPTPSGSRATYVVERPTGLRPRNVSDTIDMIMAIEDSSSYVKLRDDMVEHLWSIHADM